MDRYARARAFYRGANTHSLPMRLREGWPGEVIVPADQAIAIGGLAAMLEPLPPGGSGQSSPLTGPAGTIAQIASLTALAAMGLGALAVYYFVVRA